MKIRRTLGALLPALLVFLCGPQTAWANSSAAELLARGDAAFAGGDFASALTFYREYLASPLEDSSLREEALGRIVTTEIRMQDCSAAEKNLTELEALQPDSLDVALLRSELLTLCGKPAESVALLQKKLAAAAPEDITIRLRILPALAAAQIEANQPAEAIATASTYAALASDHGDNAYEGRRYELYILLAAGDLVNARAKLDALKQDFGSDNVEEMQLLTMVQMVHEKKFKELLPLLQSFIPSTRPNPLFARINADAARHFMVNDDPGSALDCWKRSATFAVGTDLLQEALGGIIDGAVASSDTDAALAAISRYRQLFPAANRTKTLDLDRARVLIAAKRVPEGIAVYREIFDNENLAKPIRAAAASEAGHAAAASQLPEAEGCLGLAATLSDEQNAPRRWMELGQFLLSQKRFRDALEPFRKAAAGNVEHAPLRIVECLESSGDYEGALKAANELAASTSADAVHAAFLAANLERRCGRTDKAIDRYKEFLEKFPQAPDAQLALFALGESTWSLRRYNDALTTFREYQQKYPNAPNAARALSLGVHSALFTDNYEEMKRLTDILKEKYPASAETPRAEFWYIDYLRNSGKGQEAAAYLEEMFSRYEKTTDPELIPQILIDQARIASENNANDRAAMLLEKIIAEYPKSKLYADACLLAGNAAVADGDHDKALSFYDKARTAFAEAKATGREIVAVGRYSDCAAQIYAQRKDEEILAAALAGFGNILQRPDLDDFIREEMLFKRGHLLEMANRDSEALADYQNLLYSVEGAKRSKRAAATPWASKAAYAALRINLRRGTAEDTKQALRILEIFRTLPGVPEEEWRALEAEINQKFQL